jgi:hypothetical protein
MEHRQGLNGTAYFSATAGLCLLKQALIKRKSAAS